MKLPILGAVAAAGLLTCGISLAQTAQGTAPTGTVPTTVVPMSTSTSTPPQDSSAAAAPMAQRTLTRMYDNYEDAKAVVHDLEASGIPHSDISLVANADAHGRASGLSGADRNATGTSAGGGAVLGTVLGGGAGLLPP